MSNQYIKILKNAIKKINLNERTNTVEPLLLVTNPGPFDPREFVPKTEEDRTKELKDYNDKYSGDRKLGTRPTGPRVYADWELEGIRKNPKTGRRIDPPKHSTSGEIGGPAPDHATDFPTFDEYKEKYFADQDKQEQSRYEAHIKSEEERYSAWLSTIPVDKKTGKQKYTPEEWNSIQRSQQEIDRMDKEEREKYPELKSEIEARNRAQMGARGETPEDIDLHEKKKKIDAERVAADKKAKRDAVDKLRKREDEDPKPKLQKEAMLWEYSRGGNIPATPQEINRKAAQQGLDPIYDERMDPQTGFPADSKWRSDTIDHGHRVGGFAATSHGRDAARTRYHRERYDQGFNVVHNPTIGTWSEVPRPPERVTVTTRGGFQKQVIKGGPEDPDRPMPPKTEEEQLRTKYAREKLERASEEFRTRKNEVMPDGRTRQEVEYEYRQSKRDAMDRAGRLSDVPPLSVNATAQQRQDRIKEIRMVERARLDARKQFEREQNGTSLS